ncbi:MAG: hypothetical protein QHG98_07505 [Methanothrix sp.]|nr:hypothetical protein [Methanothrix sp.]
MVDIIIKESPDEAPFQVKIGSLELGKFDPENPDRSRPNPVRIKWSQENNVKEHDCPGTRPKTQCLNDYGLWTLTIEFVTLQRDLLEAVRVMRGGPHVVKTYFQTLCMYLVGKDVTQEGGTKDAKQRVTLRFREAND